MKNFMMILCLLASPLTFAYGDDASDGSNTGGNKSSGGYGSGSGGSAAALIAVGAIIYFVRKNNDDKSKFGYVRNEKESLEIMIKLLNCSLNFEHEIIIV